MKDSIIVNMKYADYDLIDGSSNVERHHVLQGQDRKKATEDGLWVPLSPEHHRTGPHSAHSCKVTKVLLQIIGQLAFELNYATKDCPEQREKAREQFRKRYGKSFL